MSRINSSQEEALSLYVSWNKNVDDQETELNSVRNINAKNMQKFYEMCASIKRSPFFDIHYPIGRGVCGEVKNHFLLAQKNNFNTLQGCKLQYDELLSEEAKLKHKIMQMKRKIRDIEAEMNQYETKKVQYKGTHAQKLIINSALNIYKNVFGMRVSVDDNSQGTILATVFFNYNENCPPVKFSINSASGNIIDFDVGSLLSEPEAENLKQEFLKSNNVPLLICRLKQLSKLKSL